MHNKALNRKSSEIGTAPTMCFRQQAALPGTVVLKLLSCADPKVFSQKNLNACRPTSAPTEHVHFWSLCRFSLKFIETTTETMHNKALNRKSSEIGTAPTMCFHQQAALPGTVVLKLRSCADPKVFSQKNLNACCCCCCHPICCLRVDLRVRLPNMYTFGRCAASGTVVPLFLTFSVLAANPKKLLYTVANPARGLLNREKRTKEKVWQHTPVWFFWTTLLFHNLFSGEIFFFYLRC